MSAIKQLPPEWTEETLDLLFEEMEKRRVKKEVAAQIESQHRVNDLMRRKMESWGFALGRSGKFA